MLDSGNYIADFSALQLLFRPVYTDAGVCAAKASDLLTLNDLTINQVSVKAHSEHEGRGLMTNFMQSLTPSNMTEEPEGTYNELSYSDKGLTFGSAAGQFVDKLHLYK